MLSVSKGATCTILNSNSYLPHRSLTISHWTTAAGSCLKVDHCWSFWYNNLYHIYQCTKLFIEHVALIDWLYGDTFRRNVSISLFEHWIASPVHAGFILQPIKVTYQYIAVFSEFMAHGPSIFIIVLHNAVKWIDHSFIKERWDVIIPFDYMYTHQLVQGPLLLLDFAPCC